MPDQKILITGAGGFIGGGLFERLKVRNPIGVDCGLDEKSVLPNLRKIDLSQEDEVKVLFEEYQPDVIFHLAAFTSPQRNEENPELAKIGNVIVTDHILKYMPKDAHLIFPSTDKVFDGVDPNPDEKSSPNPLGIYGDLKLQCEKMIKSQVKKYHIFRLAIVHSYGECVPLSQNAGPGSFLDKAINDLKVGEEVPVYNNVERCYIKRQELLDLFERAMEDTHYGLYHVGSPLMSYYDRLCMLCEEIGLEYQGKVIPEQGEENPLAQNMNVNKLKEVFNFTLS